MKRAAPPAGTEADLAEKLGTDAAAHEESEPVAAAGATVHHPAARTAIPSALITIVVEAAVPAMRMERLVEVARCVE